MFHWVVAISVTVAVFVATNAQAQYRLSSFELSAGPAITLSNHPDFPEIKDLSYVVSAKAAGRLNGSKPYHKNYHYPYFGIQSTFASLGNNSVLGHYAGLMADMSFNKNISTKNYLEFTLGMGASYFSKPYDEITNPKNVVIGSHVTFSANAAITLVHKISDVSAIQLKALLIHCSNSHYQLPNVGLNMPGLLVGYRYQLTTPVIESMEDDVIENDRKIRPVLRVSLGFNEQGSSTKPVNGPKYPIYLMAAYVSKKISPINKVYTGLEYYFNTGSKDYILSQNFYEEKINKRSSVLAVTFGHEFLLNHFSLVTTLGINIYNKFHQDRIKEEEITGLKEKIKTYVPARIGFQYYIKDATRVHKNNLYIGLYIKSNFGQADFLESGLGYTF